MQEIYDLFSPVIFQIGPLKFYWYGLFYAISFYFAYNFIYSKIKKKISEKEFDKLFFGIAICALIGGRLGHVFFYDFGYYSQHLLEIFEVWKGGMASHGGIIGAVIGFFIFRKKLNLGFYFLNFFHSNSHVFYSHSCESGNSGYHNGKKDFSLDNSVLDSSLCSEGQVETKLVSKNLKNKIRDFFSLSFFDKKLLDLFAISGAFGFGLGRLGNFINGELFGKQIENINFFTNFIGVNFGDEILRHPVQIYSSFANFLIFGILFFLLQKKYFQEKKNFGKIFSLFLIFFGIQRFFLEFLKENFIGNNYFEILTTGQIFSLILIFVGSFLFFQNKIFCNK